MADYAAHRVSPLAVTYLLVDWGKWSPIEAQYLAQGYVKLGQCAWTGYRLNGAGIPQKDSAIYYAASIGADHVLYTTNNHTDNYGRENCDNLVSFYAKPLDSRRAQDVVTPVLTPVAPAPQTVGGIDFLLRIDTLLPNHDYARLSQYLPATTYYFGRRATRAWIQNDMDNDARTYLSSRTAPDLSTYHDWVDASGKTHQAVNEETWAQERSGRRHHAHCRFEIVRASSGIIEFHLDVVKG